MSNGFLRFGADEAKLKIFGVVFFSVARLPSLAFPATPNVGCVPFVPMSHVLRALSTSFTTFDTTIYVKRCDAAWMLPRKDNSNASSLPMR
jgi:hypothetical protein